VSLFICPIHGLHHGPFCCDQPQEWWDGTFEEEKPMNNDTGIHPAPEGFSAEQIATDPILHFFHFAHLPPKLQQTSRAFFLLAKHVVETLPRNAERTVALRKLLEAKDAAVRANLPAPRKWDDLSVTEKNANQGSMDVERAPGSTKEVGIGGHDEDREPLDFGG
jgi:hypothetical protein